MAVVICNTAWLKQVVSQLHYSCPFQDIFICKEARLTQRNKLKFTSGIVCFTMLGKPPTLHSNAGALEVVFSLKIEEQTGNIIHHTTYTLNYTTGSNI